MNLKTIFVFLAPILMIGAFFLNASAKSAATIIQIESMKFSQEISNANVGDVITWKNDDLVPHTVTATDKSFDSGTIDPGKSWSLKAKAKGTFSYKCSFHPQMTAILKIR